MHCAADDRQALEQLCRYITRSALANERVQTNAAGQVELKLKTPWRDGTTHLVMSPLEFMQRLAALVPRPRLTGRPDSRRSSLTLDGRVRVATNACFQEANPRGVGYSVGQLRRSSEDWFASGVPVRAARKRSLTPRAASLVA